MKKLIIFILLMIGMYSCEDTSIKPQNPEAETTVEIILEANKDSACYKIAYIDEVLYVVNENNIVVYRVKNHADKVNTSNFFLSALILACSFLFMMFLLSDL